VKEQNGLQSYLLPFIDLGKLYQKYQLKGI